MKSSKDLICAIFITSKNCFTTGKAFSFRTYNSKLGDLLHLKKD